MSLFIQGADHRLVREAWGFPEAILAADESVIPLRARIEHIEQVLAIVGKTDIIDHSRTVDVILRTTPNDSSEQSTTDHIPVLRLQGYLGRDFKLSRLGGWDGTIEGCQSACVLLYLEPGLRAPRDAWRDTLATLATLKNWAQAVVGNASSVKLPLSGDFNSIKCARRVFVKPRYGANVDPVQPQEDFRQPSLEGVASDWVPDEGVTFGKRNEDGSVSPASGAIFNPGDFVDIAVSLDIAAVPRSISVRTHFRLEHVVQLAAAGDTTMPSMKASGTAIKAFARTVSKPIMFRKSG